MNTIPLVIATALVIFASSMLTGCQLLERGSEPVAQEQRVADIQKTVRQAQAAKKEVELNLTAQREEGKVMVQVKLLNPNRKPLTSVQSWLSFDPEVLRVINVTTDNSSFDIPAPFSNPLDNENGLVRVGRANSAPLTDSELTVAEVAFDIIGDGTTMIDVYDYRDDLSGHVSANALVEGDPYNILLKPESPALIIEN